MYLLFSHQLNNKQIENAKDKFGVSNFIYLNKELQDLWSNMPYDKLSLKEELEYFENFIKMNVKVDDIVLIQGDFGAVYHMVNFCKQLNLKALYSTTKREVEEKVENNKTIKYVVFEHQIFREY